MTIQEFIEKNGIRMITNRVDRNPNQTDDEWTKSASHFRCVFYHADEHMDSRQMLTWFSMGPAHTEPPTAENVLDCLANDSEGVENAEDFEDWALEYGYDTDSRKAEKIYQVCKEQATKLKHFLGEENYKLLLWDVQRL